MDVPTSKPVTSVSVNKKARVFVRNLPFKTDENALRTLFGKYGKILDVQLPQKNGQPAGFGFVNFQSVNSVDMACRHLHETQLHGRQIHVSPALAKQFYDQKRSVETSEEHHSIDNRQLDQGINIEHDDDDSLGLRKGDFRNNAGSATNETYERRKEDRYSTKRKLADEHDNLGDESECCSNDDCETGKGACDSSVDDRDDADVYNSSEHRERPRKSTSTNVSKTLFVRNVPFNATAEDLQKAFEMYGKIEFAIPCKDRATDVPRGTAFVRFCRVKDMESALAAADPRTNVLESSSEMNGRKLMIVRAVPRDKLEAVVAANPTFEKNKKAEDKRNLYLINVGTVMRNSDDFEGVSTGDMQKRDLLQQRKKQTLKNLHIFISPTRISVHNLPKSCTDKKLRSIFLSAVKGERDRQITECRVMRDLQRIDTNGKPISKGFGFVEFSTHAHALKALLSVNNNPNIFSADRRPIVEFSLEDRNALLKRKRRLEHSQLRQGQLNEIKVKQKFGLPLDTKDHATLAGKTPMGATKKPSKPIVKGKKAHVNRRSNRSDGAPGWNKPNPNKKKRRNNQNAGGEE